MNDEYNARLDLAILASDICDSVMEHDFRHPGDDYVEVGPDHGWQLDVYIDDDYILGALLIIAYRCMAPTVTGEMASCLNAEIGHLFMVRLPFGLVVSSWRDDRIDFFESSEAWSYGARHAFIDWYQDKISSYFDSPAKKLI